MANNIAFITQYLASIREQLYQTGSLTSILDTQNVRYADGLGSAKTVLVPLVTTTGLQDYSRTNGYTQGDVTLQWKPFTLTKDRGTKFVLDAVDNIDSAGVALAQMITEFNNSHVVPELDAYRFAQYATGAGTKANGTLSASTIVPAIDDAQRILADASVPVNQMVCYMSNQSYEYLKQSVDASRFHTGKVINRNVTMFDDLPIITVPEARFYDSINLTAGGWAPDSGAKKINFMLIDKNAVLQLVKHNPSALFTPDQNQTADGFIYKYRIFHDALVKDFKNMGIYVHTA